MHPLKVVISPVLLVLLPSQNIMQVYRRSPPFPQSVFRILAFSACWRGRTPRNNLPMNTAAALLFPFECRQWKKMLIFLLADTTTVSKTTKTVSPETEQATDKDKGQDSGSDYGGDWSEDEWNDAQVREITLSLSVPCECYLWLGNSM